MSFKSAMKNSIEVWEGDPDCSAAENALAVLIQASSGPKLPANEQLSTAQMGNLGEAVAFLVGRQGSYPITTHRLLTGNCANPMARGSKTGLDLLWLYFDSNTQAKDRAWIQEVKTTFDPIDGSYVLNLRSDYDKLFGDRVELSLEARLGDAAFQLKEAHMRPDLALRTRAMGARGPAQVTKVGLAPTGVFDMSSNGLIHLARVETHLSKTILWPTSLITPRAIRISDIRARMTRAARA